MKQYLADITSSFHTEARRIDTFAIYPNANAAVKQLSAVMGEKFNFFTYLNHRIQLNGDWEMEANRMGEQGLDALDMALASLKSIRQEMDALELASFESRCQEMNASWASWLEAA